MKLLFIKVLEENTKVIGEWKRKKCQAMQKIGKWSKEIERSELDKKRTLIRSDC